MKIRGCLSLCRAILCLVGLCIVLMGKLCRIRLRMECRRGRIISRKQFLGLICGHIGLI